MNRSLSVLHSFCVVQRWAAFNRAKTFVLYFSHPYFLFTLVCSLLLSQYACLTYKNFTLLTSGNPRGTCCPCWNLCSEGCAGWKGQGEVSPLPPSPPSQRCCCGTSRTCEVTGWSRDSESMCVFHQMTAAFVSHSFICRKCTSTSLIIFSLFLLAGKNT